ncbi:hypothetical protein [Enterobacter asburiae]
MSTLTKEFTKEQLQQIIETDHVQCGEASALARIALASLEAEPVAYVDPFAFNNFSVYRAGETDNKRMGREWMWANPDAGLIPVYTAPPAPVSVPDYPETLPCPVMLGPGLKFGKGVTTRTMLDALQRRAEYYAELEAMTPDERAEHDAGMKEFAAMLQGADGALTNEDTKRVDELVMWIKRLAHSLRKANPDSKLQSDAMDYLSRKGLIGVKDILR